MLMNRSCRFLTLVVLVFVFSNPLVNAQSTEAKVHKRGLGIAVEKKDGKTIIKVSIGSRVLPPEVPKRFQKSSKYFARYCQGYEDGWRSFVNNSYLEFQKGKYHRTVNWSVIPEEGNGYDEGFIEGQYDASKRLHVLSLLIDHELKNGKVISESGLDAPDEKKEKSQKNQEDSGEQKK